MSTIPAPATPVVEPSSAGPPPESTPTEARTSAEGQPARQRQEGENSLERAITQHSEGTTAVGGAGHQPLGLTCTKNGCPRLNFHFKPKIPIFYFIFLVFFNLVIPCLLYYLLKIYVEKLDDKTLIGIASAALGFSSCIDAPFRLWKLVKHRDIYGPLLGGKWWHLDFSMWYYTWSMFWFAIPLAIAPALGLFDFFLFSTAMLVSPALVILAISLHPWHLPYPMSSDPPRTPTKPAIYYVLEDLVAVDFEYGKPWRRALQERYNASPVFRSNIYRQTVYWTLAGLFFVGVTAGVVWGSPLNFAFAWVLGQFFIWVVLAGLGSWGLARWDLRKEHQWWERHAQGEKLQA